MCTIPKKENKQAHRASIFCCFSYDTNMSYVIILFLLHFYCDERKRKIMHFSISTWNMLFLFSKHFHFKFCEVIELRRLLLIPLNSV